MLDTRWQQQPVNVWELRRPVTELLGVLLILYLGLFVGVFVCLSAGVAYQFFDIETQQIHPPQFDMPDSTHTHSCGADGERRTSI